MLRVRVTHCNLKQVHLNKSRNPFILTELTLSDNLLYTLPSLQDFSSLKKLNLANNDNLEISVSFLPSTCGEINISNTLVYGHTNNTQWLFDNSCILESENINPSCRCDIYSKDECTSACKWDDSESFCRISCSQLQPAECTDGYFCEIKNSDPPICTDKKTCKDFLNKDECEQNTNCIWVTATIGGSSCKNKNENIGPIDCSLSIGFTWVVLPDSGGYCEKIDYVSHYETISWLSELADEMNKNSVVIFKNDLINICSSNPFSSWIICEISDDVPKTVSISILNFSFKIETLKIFPRLKIANFANSNINTITFAKSSQKFLLEEHDH